MKVYRIYTSISIFCLLNSFIGFSQTRIPVLNDSVLTEGIYMNFEEFKQNNPSIKINVDAKETEVFVNFDTHTQYILKIKDTNDVKIRKIWGFCDGKDIYIREGVNIWRANHMFNKLEYIGRYCIYHGVSTTGGGMMVGPGGGLGGGSARIITGKVININNGVDFAVSKDYVALILKRDPELLAAYKADKKKNAHLLDYIKKYSESHLEELK